MFLIRNKIKINQRIFSLINANVESCRSHSNQTKLQKEEIQIPNRIHRSPTAILEALSSTVGNDPTAAHYKYHDDPYLIPTSNITKRTFAMAQESGRKAARWIKDQHRELFQHSVAQPPIAAFAPKLLFTEDSEVDELSLKTLIKNSEVKDAVFVYNLMKNKNIIVSDELKQSLLELLCFYNNEESLHEEFIEERWFRQGSTGKERQRKTWKDGDVAEQIFNEIEPKNCKSYATIIRGMCKFHQVERAWALFQEANEKQIELDTKTFNSLIMVVNFLKESGELRWELCLDLLQQMNQKQLKPDLGTLNALLETLSTIGNQRLSKTNALKCLSEFKSLNIEPSLATWYYILIIFCRERGPVSHVLADILKEINKKEFHIQDYKDIFFFVTAMDVCRHHLNDKNLAKTVNNLLHTGTNYNLIGDSFKESIYYRHYFALLCNTEPIEVFMQTYELLVPNVYIPEPGIMEEILKAVQSSCALDLIPRLWSDCVIFDHTGRESILILILKMMSENKPNYEIRSHDGLNEKFGNIAYAIYQKISESSENRIQKITITGQMLGGMLTLISRACINADRTNESETELEWFNKALEIFNKLDKNQHQISGVPSMTSMDVYIDACIQVKHPSEAIKCLQYCAENGLNASDIGQKIYNRFTLNEAHSKIIKSLVGMP